MSDKPRPTEYGALWRKELASGRVIYKGTLKIGGKEIRVQAWQNTDKRNEREPDLRITEDTWKPTGERSAGSHREEKAPPPSDDDLPF